MAILNKEDHPDQRIQIDTTGPDGNAFALLGYARKYAKQLGLEWEPIQDDMTSGDYDHLLDVFDKNFGEYVDLLR